MLIWSLVAQILLVSSCEASQVVLDSSYAFQTRQFSLSHAVAGRASSDSGQLSTAGRHRPISGSDLHSAAHEYSMTDLKIRTRRQSVWRPRARGGSREYMESRRASIRASRGQPQPFGYRALRWEELELEAPDTSDMETLSSLAKMTSNAYIKDHESGWYELGGEWNMSTSFGWNDDGLRGHVFATPDNATIVLAIKGTSSLFVGGNGKTNHNDKVNDNLLFSCCCARVDWSWTTVCDCYDGSWKCGGTCIEDALIEESVYYPLATDLYNNVTRLYPHSQIWLTGHSLGGSLASLLGLTFGVPVVTFEAPGDLLPAKRLHLPLPPGRPANSSFGAVTHVYHTADPIPQGACTGSLSPCSLAGYAMETRCHTGVVILFDTVGKLGWSVDTRTHSISQVIDRILLPDWDKPKEAYSWLHFPWWRKKRGSERDEPSTPPPEEEYGRVPVPSSEEDCVDCFKWDPPFDPPRRDSASIGPSLKSVKGNKISVLYMGYYIPPARRKNLSLYSYSSTDKSLLSKYVLNPYWNWLVSLFPPWIAPNLITLSGLLFVGVNFLTLIYFLPGLTCTPKPLLKSLGGTWDPLFPPSNPLKSSTIGWTWVHAVQNLKGVFGTRDSYNVAPEQTTCPSRWLYFSWAAGLWIYQSMDAIDGKQARKTKTSGPLGEMFDHGCDAINTTLEVLLTAAAINLGQSWWTVASIVGCTANFYLTTWEEYNTKVLYLSVFSGPVEGILMVVGLYLITGFTGPAFWDQGILTVLGLAGSSSLQRFKIKDLPLNECFLVFGAFGLLFNIISSSLNVVAAKRKRKQPFLKPLLGLLPFVVQALTHIYWLIGSPLILQGHLIPFACYWGVSFAYMVGLLITAHVTTGPFPYWNVLSIWSLVCAVDANLMRFFGVRGILHRDEVASLFLVYGSLALSIAVYGFFIYDVVGDVCDFFQINCLTIKRKPTERVNNVLLEAPPALSTRSAARQRRRM